MRLQIEPPGRLRIGPAVHRQGDQVRTILEVTDDHAALTAGAAPDCRETRRTPSAALRTPQAHSGTANAAHRAVRGPDNPDEPARRIAELARGRWTPWPLPISAPSLRVGDRDDDFAVLYHRLRLGSSKTIRTTRPWARSPCSPRDYLSGSLDLRTLNACQPATPSETACRRARRTERDMIAVGDQGDVGANANQSTAV
jgi:hypothetical protein